MPLLGFDTILSNTIPVGSRSKQNQLTLQADSRSPLKWGVAEPAPGGEQWSFKFIISTDYVWNTPLIR